MKNSFKLDLKKSLIVSLNVRDCKKKKKTFCFLILG